MLNIDTDDTCRRAGVSGSVTASDRSSAGSHIWKSSHPAVSVRGADVERSERKGWFAYGHVPVQEPAGTWPHEQPIISSSAQVRDRVTPDTVTSVL